MHTEKIRIISGTTDRGSHGSFFTQAGQQTIMKYTPTYTSLLSFLFLCALAVSLPLEAQVPDWERVDETREGPISSLLVQSILVAKDGRPVVIAQDGIYRIEERLVGDFPMLVGIMVEPNIRMTGFSAWSGALYAANQKMVYRSGDSGATWNEIFSPESVLNIFNMSDASGNLVVPVGATSTSSTYNRLRIYSPDGTLISSPGLPTSARAVGSSPSGRIYVLGDGANRIFHSDDLGATWKWIEAEGMPGFASFDGMRVLADSVLAIHSGMRLHISTDAGGTWFPAGLDSEEYIVLRSLSLDTNGRMAILLTGLRSGQETDPAVLSVAVSSDSGRTWQRGCGDLYWPILATSADGTLYAFDNSQLVMKRECGEEWTPIPFGFRSVPVREIVSSPDGRFYATIQQIPSTRENTYREWQHIRSDDGGRTWHAIARTRNGSVVVDALGNIYIETDSIVREDVDGTPEPISYRNIERSSDGGQTWSALFNPPIAHRPWPVTFDLRGGPDSLVVATVFYPVPPEGTWISGYQSTDGGRTFERSPAWSDTMLYSSYRGAPSPYTYAILPDGQLLVATGRLSGQQQWEPGEETILYDPRTDERRVQKAPAIFGLTASRRGDVYAWSNSRAFRSEDRGRSWTELELPVEYPSVSHIRETADGTLWYVDRNELYRSEDQGLTWTLIERTTHWDTKPDISFDNHIPAIVLEDGTVIDSIHIDRPDRWFGNRSHWHYFSLAASGDGGRTWELMADSTSILDRKHITAIARGPDGTLLVGTQAEGIYRLRSSSGSAEHDLDTPPDALYLSVVPNPVHDRTTISLHLGRTRDEKATLALYDLLGRPVQTIYDGPGSPGLHPIPVDLSTLPSGPYFLRLQQGDEWRTVGIWKN